MLGPAAPTKRPMSRTALRRVNVRLPEATASRDAVFILMRRMRWPLVVLIMIFVVDVVGLTLMPGIDDHGRPYHLTFFDAFYVMSYTATTIGYGETPFPFTIAQRMWVTFAIYSSVVGWAYTAGSILSLIQDRGFQRAVSQERTAAAVRGLREPFLIIAGYGQMGRQVAEILDGRGRRLVVVDADRTALDELTSGRLTIDVPGVEGDARDPAILTLAGMTHPYCEGILALTHDDSVNVAVVMAVQLLRPDVPVYARAIDRRIAETMHDFRADGIINPYDRFGTYLAMRLQRPAVYQLVTWLLAPYDAPLGERYPAHPDGRWLAVSDDHFAEEVAADLRHAGLDAEALVPDPAAWPDLDGVTGLVAGTTDDSVNLSLAAHARLLQPDAFLVVRAQSATAAPLLRAFAPDSTFIAAALTAQEALARVITPDFWTFFCYACAQDDAWADALLSRLVDAFGTGSPNSRRLSFDKASSPELFAWLGTHELRLGDLLRDPHDRERDIAAVPLILTRRGTDIYLPEADTLLQRGDELVVAGRTGALNVLDSVLTSPADIEYVTTGRRVPSTWIFRRLAGLPR